MKDATVARNIYAPSRNLASWFCRNLFTALFLIFLQIERHKKHVMSNGVIKQIVIKNSRDDTGRNLLSMEVEDNERIHGVAMATQKTFERNEVED